MTKKELIQKIAEANAGLSQGTIADIVTALFDAIKSEISGDGEKFTQNKFGTFSKIQRGARDGKNPKTGAKIKIPASFSVNFKASEKLKEAINK